MIEHLNILIITIDKENTDALTYDYIKSLKHNVKCVCSQNAIESISKSETYDLLVVYQSAINENTNNLLSTQLSLGFPKLILIQNDHNKNQRIEDCNFRFDFNLNEQVDLKELKEIIDDHLKIINFSLILSPSPAILINTADQWAIDTLISSLNIFETDICSNSDAAIIALKTKPYNILITDSISIHLDLIKKTKRMLPHISIILIPDEAKLKDTIKGFLDGVSTAFAQPLSSGLILNTIERIWEAQKLERVNKRLVRNLQDITMKLVTTNRELKDEKEKSQKAALAQINELNTFKNIINNSADGLYLINSKTGEIIDVNTTISNMTGYTKEELKSMKIQDLEILDDSNSITKFLPTLINPKSIRKPLYLQSNHLTKAGTTFKVEISLSMQLQQSIPYLLAIVRDISERIEKERQINRLSYVIEKNPVIVIITNKSGIIEYVNPSFESNTGYTYAEAMGKNVRLLNSGKQDKTFYQNLWSTIKSGNIWQGIFQNRKKNGDIYWGRATISPLLDESGTILNFIALQENISDQVLADEKEKKQREQLLETSRLATLGTLIAGVGHEINNPNNFIMMNSPILLKMWTQIEQTIKMNEVQKTFQSNVQNFELIIERFPVLLNDIFEGSKRIKNIVTELRNFSKKDDYDYHQTVKINEIVKSACTLLQSIIVKYSKNMELNLEENLPTIKGNIQRMEQVFISLIKNSCEAMANRPGNLTVTVKYNKLNKNIEVEIKDQGYGILQEHLEKIKDPFFTTKRDKGGTGLGISIANTIVERHKGKLEFNSIANEGTIAKIILPVDES